jgi:hypothetical protein
LTHVGGVSLPLPGQSGERVDMNTKVDRKLKSHHQGSEDQRSWATFWYIMIGLAIIFLGVVLLLTQRNRSYQEFSTENAVHFFSVTAPVALTGGATAG